MSRIEGRWPLLGAACLVALVSSGCGGGSGSSGGTGGTPPPMVPSPPPPPPPPAPPSTIIPDPPRECETRDELTLCVTVQDTRTQAETVAQMTELFFDVYPRLTERFNPGAPATVNFIIGPAPFIAGALGDTVTYQTDWLVDHPEDYDVVVHEIMHLVQAYQGAPGWLTEGIADYVRHYYGVNHEAAGWGLQMPTAGSSYTSGYGTTGRFLIWVETRYDIELVDVLDATLRAGSYAATIWVSYTGKTVAELWADYVADPAIDGL